MQPTDNDILNHINREKEKGFSLLLKKYRQRIYWHIRKMVLIHEDADDLVQNTFIKAWNNIDSFRGDASIFTWLYRIATNETLNHLNKKRAELIPDFQDIEALLSSHIDSDPLFTGDEIQKKLQKAILTLPEKQRVVFNMKYFDELTYEQMASILDTSVGALKASYFHATKKIELMIKNELF